MSRSGPGAAPARPAAAGRAVPGLPGQAAHLAGAAVPD